MRPMRRSTHWLIATLLAGMLLAGATLSASAHETREVGEFQFVVGFMNEPAYVDEMNGIDLRITRLESEDHENEDEEDDHHNGAAPVENAHETLRAAVIFGGETMEVDLRPVWGNPGAYTADVIPTRTGAYSFQFIGEIEGQEINETFRAGPDTFSEIHDRDALLFPSEGTTGASDSDQAMAIGIAGVVAGLLGLVAGAAAYYKVSSANPSQPTARQARAQAQRRAREQQAEQDRDE
jgi:hypothetical protein